MSQASGSSGPRLGGAGRAAKKSRTSASRPSANASVSAIACESSAET